ncbi:extracellular solute-binding protein [Alicyclobacillus mengziensis]|uniref:Extracellular solute-binding protein n=1 Tax=Alicyclobacillus mengziensis TaxID=2931921 RepID=A0A9X7W2B0_9BACL|nr:extracellular solute-binding protein [Alicyclobacillus mengziensis]QSO49344.1 extracellular solute-binding protein [Alicyclobacillus mengziensis]
MKARQILTTTASVSLLGILVVGCGSNGSTNSSNASSNTSSSSGSSQTIQFTLLKHFNSNEAAFNKQQAQKFESLHPNVKVHVVTAQTGSVYTKLVTLLSGGQAPNVYYMNGQYFAQLVSEGALSPVNYKALGVSGLKQLESEYIPGALDAYIYKGQLYGIPGEVSDFQAWVNAGDFKAAGISQLPTTWGQVAQDAAKLTVMKNGQVQQEELALGLNFPGADWDMLDAIVREFNNGHGLVSSDGTKSYIDAPGTIQAFQMLQDLVYKYHAWYPSLNGSTTASERVLFGENKAAMLLDGGSWYTPVLQQQYPNVYKTATVTPYPTAAGQPSQAEKYGFAYVVPKAAPNQTLDWEYVNMMKQQFALPTFKMGLYMGLKSLSNTSTAKSTEFWQSKWVPSLQTAHYKVSLVNGTQISQILDQAYVQIVTNHANVASTLQSAQQQIQPLLNK